MDTDDLGQSIRHTGAMQQRRDIWEVAAHVLRLSAALRPAVKAFALSHVTAAQPQRVCVRARIFFRDSQRDM